MEKSCTFFGHRDCPESIGPELAGTVERLILERGVRTFYVGVNGAFDRAALKAVGRLRMKYPEIRLVRVLAYLPTGREGDEELPFPAESLYPEGLETVPRRFAISFRNRWMVRNADLVVTWVNRDWGGAAAALRYAKGMKKEVIRLEIPGERCGKLGLQSPLFRRPNRRLPPPGGLFHSVYSDDKYTIYSMGLTIGH